MRRRIAGAVIGFLLPWVMGMWIGFAAHLRFVSPVEWGMMDRGACALFSATFMIVGAGLGWSYRKQ